MPRVARLDTPDLLHNVMIRGIERRRIFKDDEDREDLIERLSVLLPKTKTQCYVKDVLSESEKQFSRKHKLKSQGYDFEKSLKMVCAKFQMEKEWVIRRGKYSDGEYFGSTRGKGGQGRGLPTEYRGQPLTMDKIK